MSQEKPDQKSSTNLVFEAVQDLRLSGKQATRVAVSQITGLKLSIVDDRLRTLVNDGRLSRLIRGVYDIPPGDSCESGPVSLTVFEFGFVEVAVADKRISLTPHEVRTLAKLLAGYTEEFRMSEISKKIDHMYMRLERGRVGGTFAI